MDGYINRSRGEVVYIIFIKIYIGSRGEVVYNIFIKIYIGSRGRYFGHNSTNNDT